ncbi:lysylphosphatidylglycerol synthase domain-containing protein [Nocardioides conyzicola]|uniref:Uncharacterized protein n=1 Tax=Nocardioides conyzicola TaxID=1651781 RepID=A0ABP8WJL7_9ACTN
MPDSRYLPALRVVFLGAVVAFAWFGLRGRFDEVGTALGSTSGAGLAGALVLVLGGLLATGVLWRRLMAAVGADLPVTDGLATFFVGQLGKYIPGSVWSIGAQAQMAGRRAVPPRATVTAGLLFLGYHVATAVVVGTTVLLLGGLESPWPSWLSVLLLVGALAGQLPAVVRRAGARVGGRSVSVGATDTLVTLALMTVTWASYAAALVLLAPGFPWPDLVALGGAFALAYAVGVVIVLAPAGVGARDALLVLLLTPLLGVADATALALLARVVHTAADALMAAGWWVAARSGGLERPLPEGSA